MLITLIMKSSAVSFPLPQKVSGRYWIEADGKDGEKIACIDANGDKWQISLRENIFFHNNESRERTFVVEDKMAYYALSSHLTGNNYFVFIEPSSPDRRQFIKYAIESNAVITIGRTADNTVCFENRFVSSHHAQITVSNSKARIDDLGSANGTYLNGEKIVSAPLNYGDVLFVCGLRLTVLNGFIAVNNPDGYCTVSLPRYMSPTSTESGGRVNTDERLEFEFFRSPRFKRSIHTKEVKVDSPPQSEIGNDMPILLSLAPAATMGLASLTTAGFSLSSAISKGSIVSAIPALIMSICMLTGMVLWPTIIKKIDKKNKIKNENERQKKYSEYISTISKEIDDERSLQEDILRENYTRVNECVDRISNIRHTLWEREYGQEDFLCLRLGSGEMPMGIKLDYSQRKFSIKKDNLEDAMYKLCESPKVLSDVPITFSLTDHRISGVVGREAEVNEFAKGIIVQLMSLHSYDEVKLVIIEDENSDFYSSLKWVPHLWNNERTVRLAASNESELKEISAYLEKELESRLDNSSATAAPKLPYYIVLSFNEKLANKSDLIKKLYSAKADTNFSVIHFVGSVKNLPKECSTIIELSDRTGKVIMKNDISARNSSFVSDNLRPIDLNAIGISLANIYLSSQNEESSFPSIITFLQLFGAGKVEHLNCLSRWHENDPTQSLETAVGVDSYGDTFMLDLHEKFHGPHGLVAGMTGSGKSEFIMTFILSLAVNYHPDEVAFILIDYKGGGMAKAFENLPHVAGIITNLDGSAVRRALVSIESELKRRQALFVEASKAIGVSNIDIYKYQRLYREGTVKVPLQHLFIISDEFAELKAQQSDFMTQLISTARIGRSLGVHLILATQKPSGVVDDQIWSNSKFRICLKVQERADSMDMLKRPDAAELKTTGRFFLQVGYNELFSIGQSAWAGATYYPADTAQTDESVDVEIIDKIGRTIKQVKLEQKRTLTNTGTKQLDAVTKYIRRIADEEQIKVKPLWLPPIEPVVYIEKLAKTYGVIKQKFLLNTLIGECDAPTEQKRFPLLCCLNAESGNVIVNGVSGSGKTTFITTLVCGIIAAHTPEEVNIYIVDYGAETLTAFSGAPQVGDVVLSPEREKADNLFKFLAGELESRKRAFSQFEGSYSGYIKHSGKTLPQIVVVINNYTAFAEIQENKEEIMQTLTREGTKYGIYFVVSATGVFAVRMKLAQNFKQIFALTQNDTGDYAALVGRTEGLFPSGYPGRGLVRLDSVLYEFQTALPFESTDNESLAERIERFAARWDGAKAPHIGVLPQTVDADYMAQFINPETPQSVPVGVNCRTLGNSFVNLSDRAITTVLSSSGGHSGFVSNMVRLMSLIPGNSLVVFDTAGTLDIGAGTVFADADECEKKVIELFKVIVNRHNEYKAAAKEEKALIFSEQITVFIESYSRLRECLSEEGKDKLAAMLNKNEPVFGVSFVIGERVKNTSLYNFETWYKNHVTQGDGIWIGAGITEQFTLKPSKYTPDMYEDSGDAFGYIITKGRGERLKVMSESED